MAAIIENHSLRRINTNLPREVLNTILDYTDACSYIIKNSPYSIDIFDFNTHILIRRIPTFYLFRISVSPSGIFVAGSNKNRMHIWNIMTGELNNVIVEENFAKTPFHTFTPNNELLIAFNNLINCYTYYEESNTWNKTSTYQISTHEDQDIISCIKHNSSLDIFACGTDAGYIYIFDTRTKNLIHTFSLETRIYYNEIRAIDFKNNILVATSYNSNNIFDIITKNSKIIEEPDIEYDYKPFLIDTVMITPCLKKLIGQIKFNTFIWEVSTGILINKL